MPLLPNIQLATDLKKYLRYYHGRVNFLTAIRDVTQNQDLSMEPDLWEPLGPNQNTANKFLLSLAKYAGTYGKLSLKQDTAIEKMFVSGTKYSETNRFQIALYLNEYAEEFSKDVFHTVLNDLSSLHNSWGNNKHPDVAAQEFQELAHAHLEQKVTTTPGFSAVHDEESFMIDSGKFQTLMKSAEMGVAYGMSKLKVVEIIRQAGFSFEQAELHYDVLLSKLLAPFEEQGYVAPYKKLNGLSVPAWGDSTAYDAYDPEPEFKVGGAAPVALSSWAAQFPLKYVGPQSEWVKSWSQNSDEVFEKYKSDMGFELQPKIEAKPKSSLPAGSEDPELEKMGF